MKLINEADPEARILRQKLDRFYATHSDYPAFIGAADLTYFWRDVAASIECVLSGRETCRILEVGAGRTRFGQYLAARNLRRRIHLALHDVSALTADWLRSQSDASFVGPVSAITGTYDIILHTFVLEHMTNPGESIQFLLSRLAPGGEMYMLSPRYDLPMYLPPACDHLRRWARFRLAICLCLRRLMGLAESGGQFLLLDDPAVLHLPWSRDRDAVHLVSLRAVEQAARSSGAETSRLHVRWDPFWRNWRHKIEGMSKSRVFLYVKGSLKDWVVRRFLMLAVRIRTPGPA